MADSTLNRFLARGSNAQRLAYTPSPPTPASGPSPTYFWYETDTGDSYAWDGSAWDQVNNASGSVTTTGSPASGNLSKFSGAATVTNGDLSGDVTTSGTLATTIANNAVTTAKINNSAVTLAKIANAAANSKLLGSGAAGSGSAYAELTLGTGLSMSGTTLNASGGGWQLAGTGQTAAGAWDQAVDGSKANVDFADLASATEILLIAQNVGKSVTGQLQGFVSVDNGSTFFTTSGDYASIDGAGVGTNSTNFLFHGTNATAGRSGMVQIHAANVAAGARLIEQKNNAASHKLFLASTSAINAVRISGTGGGNLSSGKIFCFIR